MARLPVALLVVAVVAVGCGGEDPSIPPPETPRRSDADNVWRDSILAATPPPVTGVAKEGIVDIAVTNLTNQDRVVRLTFTSIPERDGPVESRYSAEWLVRANTTAWALDVARTTRRSYAYFNVVAPDPARPGLILGGLGLNGVGDGPRYRCVATLTDAVPPNAVSHIACEPMLN